MGIIDVIKRIVGKEDKIPDAEIRFVSELSARVIRAKGPSTDLGIVSRRCITNAFVNYLVDSMQDATATPMDKFYYHDCGTGNAAESATETTMVGAYGGARSSGSLTEGASANIFKSVALFTFTSSFAITEHGIFSDSSGGTMLDRSSHAAINVASDDSIEYTYQMTAAAGG